MTTQSFWQGDTVQLFHATSFDDLGTASSIVLIITKPSGAVALWTATQVDPTDPAIVAIDVARVAMGLSPLVLTVYDITYTTLPTDLDETGTYKIQSAVTWGADSALHGNKAKFKVNAHLPEA